MDDDASYVSESPFGSACCAHAALTMLSARRSSHGASHFLVGSCRWASGQAATYTGWQVSSFGRCRDSRGALTLGNLHPSGYRKIYICERKWPVHRVVKMSFHGPPKCPQAWQVHHQDGNKTNNRLDNLEYVTPSQNMIHYYATASRQTVGAKNSRPVQWRAIGSQSWTLSSSIQSAANELCLSPKTVSRCCHLNLECQGLEIQFHEVGERTLPEEEWQPMRSPLSGEEIPGRMVSSFGRLRRRDGRVHHGHLTQQGYIATSLGLGGSHRNRKEFVHRLVVASFLGLPPTSRHTCINHKDGNKSNNALDNLEWTTPSGNMAHFFANAAVSHQQGLKPVWSRRLGKNDEWTWHPSVAQCANALGVHSSNVSRCLHGMRKHAGGHEFLLATDAKSLPGEEWRQIDIALLLSDRALRTGFCG